MFGIEPLILNFAVAIGIGLLIGAERERRKGDGPTRSPAGIRTFTITALAGAVSITLGGELLLTVAASGVILLACIAYWRGHDDDPGLTTEIALILTMLIGGVHRPIRCTESPHHLDRHDFDHGDQRGWLHCDTRLRRSIRSPDRRLGVRLHFQHRHDRRDGGSGGEVVLGYSL